MAAAIWFGTTGLILATLLLTLTSWEPVTMISSILLCTAPALALALPGAAFGEAFLRDIDSKKFFPMIQWGIAIPMAAGPIMLLFAVLYGAVLKHFSTMDFILLSAIWTVGFMCMATIIAMIANSVLFLTVRGQSA